MRLEWMDLKHRYITNDSVLCTYALHKFKCLNHKRVLMSMQNLNCYFLLDEKSNRPLNKFGIFYVIYLYFVEIGC